MKVENFLIYIIVFLKTIYGSNTNLTRNELHSYECDDIQNISDSFYKHSCIGIRTLNNDYKQNENMELIDFLNNAKFIEPSSDELNECSPVSLDYDVLNEILNDNYNLRQFLTNNPLSCININFKSNIKTCNNKMKTGKVNSTSVGNFNLNSSFLFVDKPSMLRANQDSFNEYVKRYRTYLLNFTSKNISNSFSDIHKTRIYQISETFEEFNAYRLDYKTCLLLLEPSQENLLVHKLRYLFSLFDQKSGFNQKTCFEFIMLLETTLCYEVYFYGLSDYTMLFSDFQRKFLFYSTFFKLYKYVADIPEILTLGRLYENKKSIYITFLMHSIDLFGKYIGNMKDNRTFILCFIFKAFEVFFGKRFDCFLIPSFKIRCRKNKHDFYYFAWEFNKVKRSRLSRRSYPILYCSRNDKLLFRTVLLIYLYQHLLFMNHFNINIDNKKIFADFIDKVTKSNECIGCLFNEYLILVQTINKKVF